MRKSPLLSRQEDYFRKRKAEEAFEDTRMPDRAARLSKKEKYEAKREKDFFAEEAQYQEDIRRQVERYLKPIIDAKESGNTITNIRPKSNDLLKPQRGKSGHEDIFPFVTEEAKQKADEEQEFNRKNREHAFTKDKGVFEIDYDKEKYNEDRWQEARVVETEKLEEEELIRQSELGKIHYPIGTHVDELHAPLVEAQRRPQDKGKDLQVSGPLRHHISPSEGFNLPTINIIDQVAKPQAVPKPFKNQEKNETLSHVDIIAAQKQRNEQADAEYKELIKQKEVKFIEEFLKHTQDEPEIKVPQVNEDVSAQNKKEAEYQKSKQELSANRHKEYLDERNRREAAYKERKAKSDEENVITQNQQIMDNEALNNHNREYKKSLDREIEKYYKRNNKDVSLDTRIKKTQPIIPVKENLPTSPWIKTLELPKKIEENLNFQNDSKKNSDPMAHLLGAAALGSLLSQSSALPNDQKHYTQAEKDANTHSQQGSNDVDDFLYSARHLGKNGFAKALKLLGQSKSEAELKEILNVAKGVLEQSKGKAGLISMIDTTLNNRNTMSPRISIKQHIAEITSRVKLDANDEIMMADKRLDDTDLRSLTATGIRKVDVASRFGVNTYKQDEYGYDDAGKPIDVQKRKSPSSVPSSQSKKVKLVDDVTQNATQNSDPEGGPAAGNAADPTMPKAGPQWSVPNVPVARPDDMVYFKRGKSSGAEMFGLNSFIGAEQMKKSDFLNLFPQYATQDMVRGTRFREDANTMEIKKENIKPKFVDQEKKMYLKIDENGMPFKYGESPITFPLQDADMKRFEKSTPIDPRIQYDTTDGYFTSLKNARKIIPDLDFSQYEVKEPETIIPVPNVGQPGLLPVAPEANIFDSMNINAAKQPDYDPYRQAASAAWNGALNTGQILAASYIGANMGPVGGLLFNHALNGMMSSLSKYDPGIGFTRPSQGQSGQNPDASHVVHDLTKKYFRKEQKEETSADVMEQAPQILNRLTVQAENQRVGTQVVDAFSKGQVAQSQVSQTAKGFQSFYRDSITPFAIDLPVKAPEKPLQ